MGFWWHFNDASAVTLKKKNLHYICMAAPAEVAAKDRQTERCLPGACRAIQSYTVEFSVWRDDLLFIRTASSGNVRKSTNALWITQMMDTLIPWESLAMKWIFFIFFIFLYFPALFGFLLRFSAGSQCVTVLFIFLFSYLFIYFFPSTRDLLFCKRGKYNMVFWPISFTAEGGLFSPQLLVSTTVAVWHSTASPCANIMYTACLEAMEIVMSL